MLFKSKRMKELEAENALLRQANQMLQKTLEDLIKASENISKRAHLIGISRNGRVNTFTFARAGTVYSIETMGLISDNLAQWKKDLIE